MLVVHEDFFLHLESSDLDISNSASDCQHVFLFFLLQTAFLLVDKWWILCEEQVQKELTVYT